MPITIYLSSMTKKVIEEYYRCTKNSKLIPPKPSILLANGLISEDQYDLIVYSKNLRDKVFLDSGTWTLNNQKADQSKKINLRGYIARCEVLKKHIDLYANFDSNFTINGFDENMNNMLEMEKAGLKPVPVVHSYQDDEINFYIDRGHRDVALGSCYKRNIHIITYAARMLADSNVNVHLFAASSYNQLYGLPITSCDSTSWTQNVIFGNILYWNPLKQEENKTDIIYFNNPKFKKKPGRTYWGDYRYQNELENFLKTNLGINDNHLFGFDADLYKQVVNVMYYIQLQKIISGTATAN